MNDTTTNEYVIDAKGKRLGRVATEAASVLMGKNTPSFTRNETADITVKVINTKELDISLKKRENEEFQNYSGYPSGLRREKLGHFIDRRGYDEMLKKVVSGMLPKNKLHKPRMKNLIVTE